MNNYNTFNNLDFIFDKDEGVNEQISIKTSTVGMELNYDTNTINPKSFRIRPSGINWTDNTNNFTTSLESLSLIQSVLSSINVPPNTETLNINYKVLATDPTVPTKRVLINGSTPNITITDGINTNILTAIKDSNASTINITDSNSSSTFYPTFSTNSGTTQSLNIDKTTSPLSYVPSTGTLTTTNFSGLASNATQVRIDNNNANLTHYLTFADNHTVGQYSLQATSGLAVNPNDDSITATTFIGDLNGNSTTTTNVSGGLGGQVLYQSAVNTTAKLSNGTSGQVLTSQGTTLAPIWSAISAPNPTLIQTEDMIYYPELILNAAYPALAGIMGTEIPLAVYNFNGTTETWNGGYNANLLSGSLQRLGCSLLYSGAPGYTQHTSINEYSFTQISKITWGFSCLGNNYPDGLPTLTTDATYVMGLAPTADRFASLFATNTTNSIFWCWNGSTYSPPITTKFSFIINGVSQYTLTTNTNMTGKWGRCGFTINYVSGNTAQVQGFFTDLSTGITETTGVYTITGGTGFVNPITSPNACSVYHSIYGNGPRWFLVDYIQVETPNLYQIGVGSTQITGR